MAADHRPPHRAPRPHAADPVGRAVAVRMNATMDATMNATMAATNWLTEAAKSTSDILSTPFVDAYNGVNGLSRAALFSGTVMPAIRSYQELNRWKEQQADLEDPLVKAELQRRATALHEKYAPHVLQLCLRLRGVYLKLGQVCSTLPAVPLAYRKALRVLQDGVPPKPPAEIHQIISDALGKPLSDLFASFDDVPVGSASVGQVHRAVLHDGRVVAVKSTHARAHKPRTSAAL